MKPIPCKDCITLLICINKAKQSGANGKEYISLSLLFILEAKCPLLRPYTNNYMSKISKIACYMAKKANLKPYPPKLE